jgi:hypothetical protein
MALASSFLLANGRKIMKEIVMNSSRKIGTNTTHFGRNAAMSTSASVMQHEANSYPSFVKIVEVGPRDGLQVRSKCCGTYGFFFSFHAFLTCLFWILE